MQAYGLRPMLLGGLLCLLISPLYAAPLHDAARAGDTAAARRLILGGADVNAEDEYGFRPLYLARQRGHSNIVGMLRHAGARADFPASALRQVQALLGRLGYYDGPIDGVMGSGTEQAIRDYQQAREGLAVTGEIGEDWVVALHEDVIREAQIRLKALGIYDDTIDGVLGPATRQAIGAFQTRADLTSNEQLDNAWLDPLWRMAAAGEISTPDETDTDAPASAETTSPEATAEALVGTDSQSIRQIQQRLAALGYDPGEIDGTLSPATRVAIREFQEAEGLPVTGEVSPDWVLKLDALILEQTREQLIALGFNPEQVRIEPGPQTQQAIREFQTRMGMPATGVVGEDWAQQLQEIAEARAAAEAAAQAARERNARVQRYLAALGFEPDSRDGELDVATRRALSDFQAANDLPVSGEITDEVATAVEAALWRHIQTRLEILGYAEPTPGGETDESSRAALAAFRDSQNLDAEDTLDEDTLEALNRSTVRYLQERLKILGFDPGRLDGEWDAATREAVLAFQEDRELASNETVAPAWVDTLDQEATRYVQERLQLLGLRPGNTDGEMTPTTREAIREFQSQAELPVDDSLQADWVIALDLAILKSVQARLQSLGVDTGETEAAETPAPPAEPVTAPEADDDAGASLVPPGENPATADDTAIADTVPLDPIALDAAERIVATVEAPENPEPDRDTIRALQARLQLLGFDTGTVDGLLGPTTREAIRAFQASQKLPVSGEISDDWVVQLNEERLRQTQKLLKNQGLYTGNVDGLLGPGTLEAIGEFQQQQSLALDASPSDALLSALQQAEIERAERAEQRATSEQLRGLQQRLKLLGYNVGPVDGELGPTTRRAIRRFQQRNRLTVTGEPSAPLDQALDESLTRLAQRHLRTLDYPVGPVDGQLGSATRRAIRRFQERAKLPVNGTISERLIRSLASAVATQEAAIAARRAAEEEARQQAEARARREAERQRTEELASAAPTPSVSPEVLSSIQTNLRALDLYSGEVDGVLGPATERAIRRFQQQAGVAATGTPSNALATRLSQTVVRLDEERVADNASGSATESAPEAATTTPEATPEAAPAVATTPEATPEAAPAVATPEPATTPAVETVAMTTPQPSPPAPRFNTSQIRQLQADLGAIGHNPGPVDGTLGQRTEQAVRAFQRDAGLPTTGTVDRQLLAKLSEQAAEARSQSLRRSGTRTASGNTEINGKMTFQRSNGGDLIGCSVGNIQLDMAWCNTFASRRDLDDCRVILRPNAKVLVVNCV